MDYIDFHLKIGPRIAESQYTVSSRSPSVGETSGVFSSPLTDEQLELFVLKVGLARRGVRRIHSPEWRAAQDFGEKLFRALFTDEIRAAYLTSHNDAVRQGKGLRLQLTLDAPELANYPWEFLYDPSNSQFLSLFEDTPILRYIELSRPIMPLTVAPPLRILAVASSPKDYEPLDLAQERRKLSTALDPLLQAGMLELDWLATATLEGLREQLLKPRITFSISSDMVGLTKASRTASCSLKMPRSIPTASAANASPSSWAIIAPYASPF